MQKGTGGSQRDRRRRRRDGGAEAGDDYEGGKDREEGKYRGEDNEDMFSKGLQRYNEGGNK